MFQHTAARRRLAASLCSVAQFHAVSTHSRPKAAGQNMSRFAVFERVSTHSRPKAAGRNIGQHRYERYRFNTQPPEGGWNAYPNKKTVSETFQHTAARRRLVCQLTISKDKQWFQHTAARRRLVITNIQERGSQLFQHTAARRRLVACV